MNPKTKNIIMYGVLAVVLVFGYVFFMGGEDEDFLTAEGMPVDGSMDTNSAVSAEFLTILLNIKSLKLDDSIFSDPVFNSLIDSSIVLVPDGNEGRPNPFAPVGFDFVNVSPTLPDPGFSTGTN